MQVKIILDRDGKIPWIETDDPFHTDDPDIVTGHVLEEGQQEIVLHLPVLCGKAKKSMFLFRTQYYSSNLAPELLWNHIYLSGGPNMPVFRKGATRASSFDWSIGGCCRFI
ncbi:MAG: hypothetical protein QNJ97_26145 [Myxococcota bacterium]|nr:hypothetical protein [Myxococcota bacterium]